MEPACIKPTILTILLVCRMARSDYLGGPACGIPTMVLSQSVKM